MEEQRHWNSMMRNLPQLLILMGDISCHVIRKTFSSACSVSGRKLNISSDLVPLSPSPHLTLVEDAVDAFADFCEEDSVNVLY